MPAVPPKSATSLSKLDCRELSVLEDVEASVELFERDLIKLFTSDTNPEPELPL